MKTKLWAIGLVVFCTLFTSAAQLFYKSGASNLEWNLLALITNWPILLGIGLYGLGAVLMIVALRGGEVTTLYPIITFSYVLVTLGSGYFFGEVLNPMKWLGVGVIIVGILMIVLGEKKINETTEVEIK